MALSVRQRRRSHVHTNTLHGHRKYNLTLKQRVVRVSNVEGTAQMKIEMIYERRSGYLCVEVTLSSAHTVSACSLDVSLSDFR